MSLRVGKPSHALRCWGKVKIYVSQLMGPGYVGCTKDPRKGSALCWHHKHLAADLPAEVRGPLDVEAVEAKGKK